MLPLMVIAPNKSEQGERQYALFTWGRLADIKKYGYVFRLPEMKRRLTHPAPESSEFNSESGYVEFRVLKETDNEQTVEVTFVDEDYTLIGGYTVTEKTVIPVYFRREGPRVMMAWIILALIATFIVTFLVSWALKKGFGDGGIA